ncbi:MAG: transposase [Gammaproteobacteria bacterium]|nr:transposase [Gammaproteobacteria bacterium]
MSLVELFNKFPGDNIAEEWFIQAHWGDQVECSKCGSHDIQDRTTHLETRFRCRKCLKFFSTKTGTVINLGYQVWATVLYQMTLEELVLAIF